MNHILILIKKEFVRAKVKHPDFPTKGKHPLSIIVEELGEASQAYNDSDYENTITELIHTIVTCIRWIILLRGEKNGS